MAPVTAPCPLCGRPLRRAQTILVCGDCHGSLAAASAGGMRATGEYAAVQQVQVAPPGEFMESTGEHDPFAERPAACSWCGKPGSEVKKLLSQGPIHICNECVGFCAEILAAELGDHWRG